MKSNAPNNRKPKEKEKESSYDHMKVPQVNDDRILVLTADASFGS